MLGWTHPYSWRWLIQKLQHMTRKLQRSVTSLNLSLVKQFLKEALKPMFKGVFNEDGGAHRMYRHFFTDAISESITQGGGFGVSTILQQQLQTKQGPESPDIKK